MIATESISVMVFSTSKCEYSPGFKITERMETLDASTGDRSYAEMSELNLTDDHENELADQYHTTKTIESLSSDDDSSVSDYDELDFYEFIDADYRSIPSSSPEKPTPTLSEGIVVKLNDGICDIVYNKTRGDIADSASSPEKLNPARSQDIGQAENVNKGTQENLDDNRSTKTPFPEQPALAQENGKGQNEDICETVNNKTQSPTTSADHADSSVNLIKKKKLRKVRCTKLESQRSSANKPEDSKRDDLETQEDSGNEETAACKTVGPTNCGDGIVSDADFEVTLPQNSSVFRNSAIDAHKEPTKRQFSETDSDESDSSGSDSKNSRINDSLQTDETQEFECQECSLVFSDRYRLFKHSSIHKTDNLFRCEECEESFAYPIMLHNHKMNRHTSEKKYICNVCNKVYKRESYLQLHMNIHWKPKFACKVDRKTADLCKSDNSASGVVRMVPNKLEKAAISKIKFERKKSNDTHQPKSKIKDKDMSNKTNKCKVDRKTADLCKSDNSSSGVLRMVPNRLEKAAISKIKFEKKKSTDTQQPKSKTKFKLTEYKCKHCDVIHKNKLQLNQHLLKEHNESLFECTECNLKFPLLTRLKQHNKDRHSKESAACPICSKVFKCTRYLHHHIRFTHEKRKNFVCKICGEKYFKSKPLRMHELKHQRKGEMGPGLNGSESEHRQAGEGEDGIVHKLNHVPDSEPKHEHNGDHKDDMVGEIIKPETNLE